MVFYKYNDKILAWTDSDYLPKDIEQDPYIRNAKASYRNDYGIGMPSIFKNPKKLPLNLVQLNFSVYSLDERQEVELTFDAYHKVWSEEWMYGKYSEQSVVEIEMYNKGLKKLLKLPFFMFWSQVSFDWKTSEAIHSFLTYRNMSAQSDEVRDAHKKTAELIFSILKRIVNCGESETEYWYFTEHRDILDERKLICFITVFSVCRIYTCSELAQHFETKSLVQNCFLANSYLKTQMSTYNLENDWKRTVLNHENAMKNISKVSVSQRIDIMSNSYQKMLEFFRALASLLKFHPPLRNTLFRNQQLNQIALSYNAFIPREIQRLYPLKTEAIESYNTLREIVREISSQIIRSYRFIFRTGLLIKFVYRDHYRFSDTTMKQFLNLYINILNFNINQKVFAGMYYQTYNIYDDHEAMCNGYPAFKKNPLFLIRTTMLEVQVKVKYDSEHWESVEVDTEDSSKDDWRLFEEPNEQNEKQKSWNKKLINKHPNVVTCKRHHNKCKKYLIMKNYKENVLEDSGKENDLSEKEKYNENEGSKKTVRFSNTIEELNPFSDSVVSVAREIVHTTPIDKLQKHMAAVDLVRQTKPKDYQRWREYKSQIMEPKDVAVDNEVESLVHSLTDNTYHFSMSSLKGKVAEQTIKNQNSGPKTLNEMFSTARLSKPDDKSAVMDPDMDEDIKLAIAQSLQAGDQTEPSVGLDSDVTDIVFDSLITEVKDILPHLGEGFIAKCLKHYNCNSQETISAILEERLPVELIALDQDMPIIPDDPLDSLAEVKGHDRQGVYDGDELDLMVTSKIPVDQKRVYKGKKKFQYKDAKKMLDDKSFVKEIKQKNEFRYDVYDDEYDDTWDDVPGGMPVSDPLDEEEKVYRMMKGAPVLSRPVAEESESSDSDEPEDQAGASRQRDPFAFCEDPAVLRERAEARRNAKYGRGRGGNGQPQNKDVVGRSKGQGQEKSVLHNRENKNAHKSSRANHNRRAGAQWKRSRGMLPS